MLGSLRPNRFGWTVPLLLAGAVALIAAVAFAADVLDRPFGFFSREPSEVLEAPWYTGFLFHVGLLTWFASAVACLFAGALIARRRGLDDALPLLAGGAVSLLFAVDDGFRLHEDFAPGVLGIPKTAAYSFHALAFGAWLVAFRRFILASGWTLLALATFLLAGSVGFDRAFASDQQHLFEDGVKFVGIVAWTVYFTRTAFQSTLAAFESRAGRA
jgi:hypothetical protein